MARRTVFFSVLAAVVIGATPASAAPLVSSTFDTDSEGWTFYTDNVTSVPVTHLATGGNPGGYISHTDAQAGIQHQRFQSAYPYGGDLSAAYGGTLTFDLRSNVAGDPNDVPVNVTFGSGNPAFSSRAQPLNFDQLPGSEWTTYTVPLVYNAWCANVSPYTCFANAGQLKDFLAQGHQLQIFADYYNGTNQITDLDNVAVNPPAKTKSKLTLAYQKSRKRFVGKLSSSKAPCVAGRTVTVFKKKKGPDHKLGKAVSKDNGSFKLAKKADPGSYFAKTGSKLMPDDGLLCTGAKSGLVSVG
jgi:Laminin B (Domain IV)